MSTDLKTPDYSNPRHPGWLRCWLFAMEHNGQPLAPGQLRDACVLEQRTLSRSLHTARKLNLITPDSNARRVTAALTLPSCIQGEGT